jgi:preprotein translocase subunit SecD
MTVIDVPVAAPQIDPAQLLFEEARKRRKRRRLISGIVLLAGVVLVGLIMVLTIGRGHGTPATSSSPNPPVSAASRSAAEFSVRPLLCVTRQSSAGDVATQESSALPPCSAASELTAANVGVERIGGGGNGATPLPPPDRQFVMFPSTSSANDVAGATVLLPGAYNGTSRYVLGPAALVAADVQSATAQPTASGFGVVNLHLTSTGAAKLDALAQQQFHTFVAVVAGNKMISYRVVEPAQTSFTSFAGEFQVSGVMTLHQAQALASSL